MSNPDHVARLSLPAKEWNNWRCENPTIRPDLSDLDLNSVRTGPVNLVFGSALDHRFDGYDFRDATLDGINFARHNVTGILVQGASMKRCALTGHQLTYFELTNCDLTDADLSGCQLEGTRLGGAKLVGADLSFSVFVRTHLQGADLTGAHVYGTAVWDVNLDGATQADLKVTSPDGSVFTVDNLKMAQFIYLLVANREVREVIDSLTSRTVLILGRFSKARESFLRYIRSAVRRNGLLPIVFDSPPPASRNLAETIQTLANLSRMVIADLSDPASVPHELQTIVPNSPSLPVVPIIDQTQEPYALFSSLTQYKNMQPLLRYPHDESEFAEAISVYFTSVVS